MAETSQETLCPPLGIIPCISSRDRTSRACTRCRRQKLKCDTEKPCTLCKRAGTKCEIPADYQWKTQSQTAHLHMKKRKRKRAQPEGASEFNSFPQSVSDSNEAGHLWEAATCVGNVQHPIVQSAEDSRLTQSPPQLGNDAPDSSALDLVKEAFNFHQSGGLDTAATSSLPRGRAPSTSRAGLVGGSASRGMKGRTFPGDGNEPGSAAISPIALNLRSQTITGLLDVLPKDHQAVNLLIDTYFDRVHWFMLVFRQDTFRERFRTLILRRDDQSVNSTENFSFACTVLTVAALGLQYTCAYRKQRLAQLNVEPNTLQSRLLSTIQTVLFDLIAIGSLESVQVCVLLGSFYLFHGCPGPALPVIGCGLRIAQGMGLHRRSAEQNSEFSSIGHETEDAKRCWLALFEIDRFCSMVYGLPISFANEDCDIGRWVLSPLPTHPSNCVPTTTSSRNSMLLFYKGHMSELSIILTEVLQELYTAGPRRHGGYPKAASFPDSHMQLLSRKISSLDRKLRNWYGNVHPLLHLEDAESKQPAYASPEAMAQDVGGSGERFERHILRMQAVTLKLAFENAIIMTHRPLLSFRSARTFQPHTGQAEIGTEMHNPYKSSIERCRKAALNTATIGSSSAFDEALDTYAVSFFGIHVFTAGVVLCLIASFEPMTSQAHEAKAGIQKLMAMQRKLQERSVVAAQGLKILEKVVALVIDKELQEVLGYARPNGLSSHCWNDEAQPASETHLRPKQINDSEVYGLNDNTVKDNQSDSREFIPNGAGKPNRETDMGDLSLSQSQIDINADLSMDTSINTASDHSYDVEDYHPYLGSFSTDIEQGWIWDPDWLVHM